MAKTTKATTPEQPTDNPDQPQFEREAVSPDELKRHIAESQTHKLKEGDEIRGMYMGCFAVETQFGRNMQHSFRLEGSEEGDKPLYYWSNWSMDKAIADAGLDIYDVVHIRRLANNVYVVDKQ